MVCACVYKTTSPRCMNLYVLYFAKKNNKPSSNSAHGRQQNVESVVLLPDDESIIISFLVNYYLCSLFSFIRDNLKYYNIVSQTLIIYLFYIIIYAYKFVNIYMLINL